MIRERYERQISRVRTAVLQMGALVDQALDRAVRSLQNGDTIMAGWVIADDTQINEAEQNLEAEVHTLLATQQPIVANDLRLMSVVQAIVWELERIGDYASGIARATQRLAEAPGTYEIPASVGEMADRSRTMVRTALEAFVKIDADLARSLSEADDAVDLLRRNESAALIARAQLEPQHVTAILELLEVIHLIERVADRATNIGERAIYLATSATESLNS